MLLKFAKIELNSPANGAVYYNIGRSPMKTEYTSILALKGRHISVKVSYVALSGLKKREDGFPIGLCPMLCYAFAIAIYASEHKPSQPLGLSNVKQLDKLVQNP